METTSNSDYSEAMGLRRRAVSLADERDEQERSKAEQYRAQRIMHLLGQAQSYASNALGPEIANSAQWTLVEQPEGALWERARAEIDGWPLEYERAAVGGGQQGLVMLLPCPRETHPPAEMRSRHIESLADLGRLFRDGSTKDYTCEACSQLEAEAEAAEARLDRDPAAAGDGYSVLRELMGADDEPGKGLREVALETAAQYAALADGHWRASSDLGLTAAAGSAAQISQAWSALYQALAVEDDLERRDR